MIENLFTLVDVNPDGNCFYRSKATLLFNDQEKHLNFRLFVINHILDNIHEYGPPIFRGSISVLDKNFEEMKHPSIRDFLCMVARKNSWGNEGVIYAMSDALNISIVSIMVNNNTGIFEFISRIEPKLIKIKTPLRLINVINLHYIAAHPRTSVSPNFNQRTWQDLKINSVDLQKLFAYQREKFNKDFAYNYLYLT